MTESASSAGPKWEADAKESIRAGLRRFKKPLTDLVERDANEGDTRLLVTDFLCDGAGLRQVRGPHDGVRGQGRVRRLRRAHRQAARRLHRGQARARQAQRRHLRQVETYAVNEGVEWVILTNGQAWQVYHVAAATGQQVSTQLVLEVDLLDDSTPASKVEKLFHLHRAALKHHTIDEVWTRRAATSPTALTAAILSDKVIEAIRSEVRRNTKVNATPDALRAVIRDEIVRPGLV